MLHAFRFASARAALAAAICAAAFGAAFAAEDDKPKQPMPPWQIQFPLDQTFSLRELNGKPVPDGLDVSLKIDGSLARHRLYRVQFLVGHDLSRSRDRSWRSDRRR